MNVLEKILEEMENESQLAHEEMRRCARGNPLQFDEVKGYARAMEYVVDTIRSHMDEVNSLEKKPVWDMDIIHHESYDLGRNVGWNECLETIQMNKNNSWIPVEEKLPEEKGWYQCTCSDKEIWNDDIVRDLYYYPEIKEFVDNIRYEANGLKDIEKYYWTKYVTAWQFQPKPYKAKEES